MPKCWKRHYPGFAFRVAATILGVCIGLYFVALVSSQSISAVDLPDYASKVLKTDHTLAKRDMAVIYALSQESNPVNLATPIRIVSSSFLGFERIDISDVRSVEYDSPSTPDCTILFSGGNACRYFERRQLGDLKCRKIRFDANLNRAAICAYLAAARGGKHNGQLTVSVYLWGDVYGVSLDRETPTMIRTCDVILSKKFEPVRGATSTIGPSGRWSAPVNR